MADKHWTENFRVITPILLLVMSAFLTYLIADFSNFKTDIKTQLTCIDEKMFKHLTNDEMHSPRSLIITKPEFEMYQSMRDKQMNDIKDSMSRIERNLEKKK